MCWPSAAHIPSAYALPGFRQNQPDGTADIALADVECCRVTATSADAVFERRVLIHDVLDDELDTDVLQIRIRRRVTRVVAHRKIECVIGRFEIGIARDGAGERATT